MIKILVTGHFSAGKTEFIRNITGNSLNTEKKLSSAKEKEKKENTTVAMDYGKVKIDDKTIHLFGTPGQERFDFMLEILSKNNHGAVIILDSSDLSNAYLTQRFIQFLTESGIPFVIACNKQDLEEARKIEEIAQILGLPGDVFAPLVAKDKISCEKVLRKLLTFINTCQAVA